MLQHPQSTNCFHRPGTGKKQKTFTTPSRVPPPNKDGPQDNKSPTTNEHDGSQVKDVDMGVEEDEEKGASGMEEATQESKASPIHEQNLLSQFDQSGVFHKIKITASGIFSTLLEDEADKQLGQARDWYIGRNYLRHLVTLHGGTWSEWVTKDTHWLVIGHKPGRTKVDKAADFGICLVTYDSLLRVIEGSTTIEKLDKE